MTNQKSGEDLVILWQAGSKEQVIHMFPHPDEVLLFLHFLTHLHEVSPDDAHEVQRLLIEKAGS